MQKEAVKRVLIRGPNWIGDAVMCEPALAAVRELFPKASMTALVKPAIGQLLTGHPSLDRIMVYEHRGRHAGLSGKWTLARELGRGRFDAAILFQNAFEAALLTSLAGIPRRYGYGTDGRGWLLTDAVTAPDRVKVGHEVNYYLDLLRPLGAPAAARVPRLYLADEEVRQMEARLAEIGLLPSEFVIGVNPGSTYGSAKRWAPERFAETADRLVRTYGGRVVIVGAQGEEALGQAIADAMAVKPIVLSGRTSIRELMAVIARCNLFLTNDTGPMHIAAAFGVPVVAIFGPTDSRTTSPFGSGHIVVREPVECSPCLLRECPIDHRCMTRVSVDQVYDIAAMRVAALAAETPVQCSDRVSRESLKGVTVFLDRDGTVNRDTGYVKLAEELDLLPGVVEAIARLNRAGARTVVITNQSGVARGLLTLEALKTIHAGLCARLHAGGARVDAIYYCPHHPDEGCACRKPEAGMVRRAAADLGLDLSRAYVVGDQRRDIDLAHRIGARSVLVTTGTTSLEALVLMRSDGTVPDYVAPGLHEAVEWILEDVKARYLFTVNRES